MAAPSSSFKLPSLIPQDLQLIQSLIGEIPTPGPSQEPSSEAVNPPPNDGIRDDDQDDIGSSGDESEREVEEDILGGDAKDDEDSPVSMSPVPSVPSDSHVDSDSDSSSDSESDVADEKKQTGGTAKGQEVVDVDDDEDAAGPSGTTDTQLMTQNEVAEAEIVIPPMSEVGPHEVLEPVGEVMSIVNNVVIVKGSASGTVRANERALDSDTLLVFEDRQVLGYVYETFGPTTQPLYQVKFNQSYPLDKEKVRVSRQVFHVPDRSNFVFVRQLKSMKGSDASNVWDEEPGEDELEFSDDEQEAAYKRSMNARRHQERAHSVASSRHTTPTPSQMRDQDMSEGPYGVDPYTGSLPYNDMDLSAGPSRPPPVPYDDPYSDSYGLTEPLPISHASSTADTQSYGGSEMRSEAGSPSRSPRSPQRERERGRGRGHASRGMHERGGRGRGRDRRGGDRRGGDRRRGRGRGGSHGRGSWDSTHDDGRQNERQQSAPRSMSPTSIAIARVTGQYSADGGGPGPHLAMQTPAVQPVSQETWGYPQYPMQPPQGYGYGYPQQYVQPHINPRFASAFAMNLGFQQTSQYAQYGYDGMGYASGNYSGNWSENWNAANASAPSDSGDGSAPPRDGSGSHSEG